MDKLYSFLENSAALITTDLNRFYLTGFNSSLGYLFLINRKKILYVDGRYIEAARKKANKDVNVRLFTKLSAAVSEILSEFSLKSVLFEADITVREEKSLKGLFSAVNSEASTELSDVLNEIRSIKSDTEKKQIILAQRTAEKAFTDILNFIKPGVTEKEIALRLEYGMQLSGAGGMSFETIAVSGVNSSLPHGVPTNKKIENGDFVTMDFGAKWGGYCSDMTRTVAVGFVTDKMAEVYETVLNAQNTAIKAIKAGVSAKSVDLAARDIIEKAGYGKYFTHSTGHGVGLYIHEQPNITPGNETLLKAGNVITCEPGIYLENMFGVRIEDMIYVTENGAENLTKSQKKLIIIK